MDVLSDINGWIALTNDCRPKDEIPVWAYNIHTDYVAIACIQYLNDYGLPVWAINKGTIYMHQGMITGSFYHSPNHLFTHWQPLPKPVQKN
jgi:hypothetical protein